MLKLITATLLTATAFTAFAQDKKPIELRYTTGSPPAGVPWAKQINEFVEKTKASSNNEVVIQPYFSSQLGSEADTIQQVARGRIDMGSFSIGAAALIAPEITLLAMPFYFESLKQFDCIVDDHMTDTVKDIYAKKNVVFLGFGEVGEVNPYGKKAYTKPSDLQGVKAAVIPSKSQVLFFQQLGGNPVPLGLTEWIPSLQSGLAETVLTVISFSLPSGLTKVAPVISKINAYNSPSFTLMNKATFDKLSPSQQNALLTSNSKPTDARREVRAFENVLHDMHVKQGGTIATNTPEERAVWRKALEPYYPKVVADLGESGKVFFDKMEAGRKVCEK